MDFSYKTRTNIIQNLQTSELDLLIIGGGIIGAGVAFQAAASGAKVGLVDMQDFAAGTSSRSTKLVHGGIRYLKNFEIGVVSDIVSERQIVQHIAPHIPRPFPMLMPIYDSKESTFDMQNIKVAMNLYDQFAGIIGGQYANKLLTRDEVLQRDPYLKAEGLQGGGIYLDFVNNDSRLVIENIKGAVELGALAASNVKVEQITHSDLGVVNGVIAKDLLTGESVKIRSKLLLNATGPWSSKFIGLDDKNGLGQIIRPTKGVHLVVDHHRLPVSQPTYSDSGEGDGRMLFVVPREGKTYFGTTDTDYYGDYQHPKVEQEDVDYLLRAINNRFPTLQITLNDIEASWVGLRPLLESNGSSDYNGGTSNMGKITDESFNLLVEIIDDYNRGFAKRRDVEKVISSLKTTNAEAQLNNDQISRGSSLDVGDDGLISLAGGKITDYRKMAAGAMAEIRQGLASNFNVQLKEIDSTKLQVSGGHFDPNRVQQALDYYQQLFIRKGINQTEAQALANLYGSNSNQVAAYIGKVSPAPGLTLADTISLHYSIDHEMVLTPVDYLARRTTYLLFHQDRLAPKKQAFVDEMAHVLHWSANQKKQQEQTLDRLISQTRLDYLKTDSSMNNIK